MLLVSYVIWLDLPPKLEEYNREHCSVWGNNRPNAGYIIRVVIRKIRRLKSSRFTHQLTTTCWKRKIIHLITSYLTQQTGKLGGGGGGGVKWLCLFFFFWARNCLYLRLWWLKVSQNPSKSKETFHTFQVPLTLPYICRGLDYLCTDIEPLNLLKYCRKHWKSGGVKMVVWSSKMLRDYECVF